MNKDFEKAAGAAMSMVKKGEGMFGFLVQFVVATMANATCKEEERADVLKEEFKDNENAYAKAHEKQPKLSTVGSYRSAKSVLVQAVEKHVVLLDGKGKPRGKTDIEKELKELKEEKNPLEKFRTAMHTATNVADKLENDTDVGLAYTECKALLDKLADIYTAMKPDLLKAA